MQQTICFSALGTGERDRASYDCASRKHGEAKVCVGRKAPYKCRLPGPRSICSQESTQPGDPSLWKRSARSTKFSLPNNTSRNENGSDFRGCGPVKARFMHFTVLRLPIVFLFVFPGSYCTVQSLENKIYCRSVAFERQ